MPRVKKVKVRVLSEVFEYDGKKVRRGRTIEMPAGEAGTFVEGGHVQYAKK
jgi:hypothetical protein